MRIGSLFSGAGGLDMAVEQVFGGEVIWQSEVDKAASKVLAYRFPCAPNLGDITAVDWTAVETPDVLCGGFPCQDVSAAGKRAGIKDGTRSGLWAVFADAIDALRPRYVVIENVRGLLSATAHRAVESDDAVVGDRSDRPVLRALGAVLGDLSDLGYDARWSTVAAASVGAPHRRERVFVLASDADQVRPEGCGLPNGMVAALSQPGGRDLSLCGTCGHEQRLHCDWIGRCTAPCECPGFATPDPTRNGWNEGRAESARLVGGFDAAVSGDEPGRVALLPTPTTQDGANNGGPSQFERNTLPLNAEVTLLPTPAAKDGSGGCIEGTMGGKRPSGAHRTIPLATAIHHLLSTPTAQPGGSRSGDRIGEPLLRHQAREMETSWGKYEPAIRRKRRVPAAGRNNCGDCEHPHSDHFLNFAACAHQNGDQACACPHFEQDTNE